jgi:hypothetical protein
MTTEALSRLFVTASAMAAYELRWIRKATKKCNGCKEEDDAAVDINSG